MPMRELVAFIARALVQDPAAAEVEEVQSDRERVVQLRVASARNGMKAKLDIVE